MRFFNKHFTTIAFVHLSSKTMITSYWQAKRLWKMSTTLLPCFFWQKDDYAFCVCPLIFSISSTILFDFYARYYFSGLHDKVSVWDKQKGVFSQYYFLLHFVIGLSGSCFLVTLFPVEKPQDSFDTI